MSSKGHVLKYCVDFVHVMEKTFSKIHGVFFNWKMSPDWLPPKKKPRLAPPPKSIKYENHIQVSSDTGHFLIMGGPVWDS